MNNQIKITLTIIAAIVVAYIGYRYMKGLPFFRHSKIIYTHYKKVNGLIAGGPVYISGVKVGSVKDIALKGQNNVKVTLSFNNDLKITKGSVAKLTSSGLLGNKVIEIVKSNNSREVPYGGTIKGVYEEGVMSSLEKNGTKLANNASESLSRLNQTLGQLQKIVDEKNRKKVDRMLSSLQVSTSQLATLMKHERGKMEQTINHADRLLANFDTLSTQNKPAIDSSLASLKQTMGNFQEISAKLKDSNDQLNDILTKIDNGKGSLGKMVNDPSLYNNLDSLSVSLTSLIDHIIANPTKYLKGLRLIDIF
jgi:ABC-type transporter Mla subunit MlaD